MVGLIWLIVSFMKRICWSISGLVLSSNELHNSYLRFSYLSTTNWYSSTFERL